MPPKKSKGKKKDDDWGDDEAIEAKIASLAIEVDEEISAPIINKNKKKKKGFALIVEDIEDEIEIEDKKSDESEVDESTEAQMERAKEFFKKQKTKKKEKGKKAKKAAKEEEEADFDSIIATLKDSKDKPKKKKEVDSLEIEKVDEIKKEDDVNVKKTVDKKDSEPIKKEADVEGEPQKVSKKKKKAGKDKKKGDDDKGEEKVSQIKEDSTIKEEEPVGEKEDDKDSGKKQKKVNKKMAALKLLLEAQEKAKEEAEKKAKEAEALWEAREKEREEKARLEEERRAKIKAEKKEREAQLKKEGKWLTPAQRLAQQRAKELLEARGIKLPVTDEKKDVPVDGKRKAFLYDTKKKKQQQNQQHKKKEEMKKIEEEKIAAEKMKAESEEKNKQEEILDDWEMADDIEKEKKPEISKHSSKDEESEEESESDEDEDDEEESDEESSEESEDETHLNKMTKEEIDNMVRARFKKRKTLNDSKKSTDNLRSPVICVLGHVDTGKTKMLDTIRRTNVQLGEAGGITQQIGATFVPGDAIKERCKMVKTFNKDKMKIPGFLIIDTPGHESFANLRTRGSSLCDIAILVVDIMHGLEPQTIESIKLLLKRNTPFVVALNKIDRLYGYESNPRRDIWEHLDSQPSNTQLEFKERFQSIFAQFAEQGLNIALAKDNDDVEEYISVIPTSAFLGDGIAKKIAFSNELECFVMEVRAIPGLGTTIDVILLNGTLKSGDIIVLTGTDGAIITQVRDLLMPSPLKEIRVKNEYQRFKSIKGAQGVKILAKNLEKAVAGLPLFVANREDEIEILKEDAETQLEKALTAIKRKPEGVYVQASTLGSLEALLEFLKSQKIPYSNVNIGPVHKKDVQKAAVMLEHNPEFACILAFDVKVERDAQLFADKENVKIFQADIIYHLEDAFLKYREDLREKKRKENEHLAIFPCKLRILPQNIFNARNPIICGVYVEAGQLKKGTPICVPSKDNIILGTVSSIEKNHEDINIAKQGDEVCIKIENTTGDAPKLYGRHFTHEDTLISKITRETIDVCKAYYREDLTKSDWQLIVQLKKILDIY
ncbi:Eukaryotic translation initiation factor 5B [Strongyloides ratti]|uniref:Eukaryotic translation initiation factor 5B n=1 Tax=Strongyloides ratti TaxID=34506 RepID=A0A090L8Y6_STRRB|nr:Eukaryotic translation initiation factor 5B [Strongyloides ratti]CEF64613.1 Eukaryotic translation initiation factor 5B [Strongyloides ratti]